MTERLIGLEVGKRSGAAPTFSRPPIRRRAIVAALVFVAAFAISLTQRVEANSNLDLLLREWIEDDLHFFPDANKHLKLGIRREPVRAHVYSEIRPLESDIRLTIGLFAQAF